MQNIGLDCRLSGDAHAGIGRYIEELIIRLPLLDKKNKYVLFFYSQQQANHYLAKAKIKKSNHNIKIIIAPIKHYSLSEQFKLPKIFSKENLDLLHVPHFNLPIFYRKKIIITIHDLLWHEFKGLNVTTLNPIKYFLKYFAYRFITAQAIKKAQKILVPANTIKKTILKYYPKTKNKILVITEGVSENFKPTQIKSNDKPNFTLIYLGSLYPHKNIKLVLEALKKLPKYRLKLIGSRNVFSKQIKKIITQLGITQQVEFTGFLPDKQLNLELQQSFALVQPSLSEGFGLTGIEAMAAGTPVLASNIPIFNEIYKKAALYFDPNQIDSFINALEKLEKSDRKKIIANGLKLAKLYSWDRMAKSILQAYES